MSHYTFQDICHVGMTIEKRIHDDHDAVLIYNGSLFVGEM